MAQLQQVLFDDMDRPAPLPAPLPRGRGRRSGWFVAAVVLLAAAAVGGLALAWMNAERANSWQATATTLRDERNSLAADLASTTETLEQTEADLHERTAGLERSEGRADRLDARVRTLSNEKAAVEDEREVAEEVAEAAGFLASQAADVGFRLDGCIDHMTLWLGATPSLYDSTYDWASWEGEGDAVAQECGQARGAFQELQSILP